MGLPEFQIWAPLVVLAVAAGLNAVRLLHLRRTNPAADAPLAAPGEASKGPVLRPALKWNIIGDLPARVGRWMAGHPLEVFLLAVLGVLSIYIWVVTPRTFIDRPHESWLPGHPYRALHFVRELQLQTADDLDLGIGVAGGLLSLVCFALSVWKENIAAARVGLLIAGLSILCLWQLSMLEAYPLEPAAPFLLGTLVILGWALDYRGRATKDLFGPLPSPTWEIALFAAFLRCYPRAERMAGDFFDRYFLSLAALTAPACGSSEVAVRLEAGSPGASGRVAFEWSAMGAAPRRVGLTCGRQSPAVLPIQAESMTGPGWETENRFASDFQGEGFLADTEGSETATLELSLTSPGPYYIWVRTYRRVEDPYAALLSVSGQTSTFGVGYEGQPTWIWERLGPFTIDTPTAVISIARPYDGPSDKFIALFFDTLVVTSLPSFTPGTDEAIEIVLDKTVTLEAAAHDGSVTAQLSPGYYVCWITLTDGNWLISPIGEIGARSAPVQFQVRGEDP